MIRFGPEDNSLFSRTKLHNGGPFKSSLSTNSAFDFNAEFVIVPRVPSFPSKLSWLSAGMDPNWSAAACASPPASHPASNRRHRRRCCVPVAFVVGSFALLLRPNFSSPLLPIQLCNNLVSSRRGKHSHKPWLGWGYTSCASKAVMLDGFFLTNAVERELTLISKNLGAFSVHVRPRS